MKKKLIAALTSAAMVATMVPATAFAATTEQQPVNTKSDTEVTERMATTKASTEETNWINAWKEVKDLNPETLPFSTGIDTDITAAATAYIAAVDAIPAPVVIDEADSQKLEKLVVKQWELRLAKIEENQNKLAGEITTDNKDLIDTLSADNTAYLTGRSSDNLYKILGVNYFSRTALVETIDTKAAQVTILVDEATAAANVVTQIAGIDFPTGDNYDSTASTGTIDKLKTIDNAYTALTPAQKNKVGNYSTLENALTEAKKLKAAVDSVNSLTEDFPTNAADWTIGDIAKYRSNFDNAWAKYEALGTGQKTAVSYTGLTTVKGYLDTYDKAQKKAAEVSDLIAKITTTTASDALTVAQAWAPYSVMNASAINDKTTLSTIVAGGYQDDVTGGGKLADAKKDVEAAIKTDAGKEAAAKPVIDMINALSASSTPARINAALDAYNALTKTFTAVKTDDLSAAYLKLLELKDGIKDTEANDQKAVNDFIAAVKAIADVAKDGTLSNPVSGTISEIDLDDDTVNIEYVSLTGTAAAKYAALTTAQLELVENNQDAKDAKKALDIAQKNAEAYNSALPTANLIKAVPDAKTLDLNNAEAVQKVKDARTAYEALTKAVQDQLEPQGFVTNAELTNYKDAADKVAKAEAKDAAASVVTAINNLPKLPEKFQSKADIDTAKAAMEQAEAAYNKLTNEQKNQVTNYQVLETYKTSFDKLATDYANALYTEAEKIDTANLTAADAAKIAELTALLNGEYGVATGDITGFNANTYEALKDALATFQATVGNLANATIEVADQSYTGEALTPAVTVKNSKGEVVNADEYMVFYENNTEVGTATVTVIAKTGGLYTGAKTGTFKINGISLADAAITVANQSYTGSALTPAVTVKVGTTTLKANTDYTVSYSNNTAIGTATVTITGIGKYSGTATKTFTISKANLKSVASVTGVVSRYYTGKNRTQTDLKVYVAGKALNKANYSVAYKNNKNVGKATLTITGKGNYTGTITKTFVIKPRKVANVKVTKGKKRVTVRYKKQNGARYQIYYKTAGSKAKTVKTTAVKRTIKNLKGGKRYTIKVRAYKKIGSKTYYGKYSAAKKVTVKR